MSVNIDEVYGSIKISEEVIASIAALATMDVDGVAEMTGGFSESISNIIGKSLASKGIKVNTNEDNVNIDIYLIVKYGVKIPDVAWNVQEKVKKDVEKTTGVVVQAVNIHVQGVAIEKKSEIEEVQTLKENEEQNTKGE